MMMQGMQGTQNPCEPVREDRPPINEMLVNIHDMNMKAQELLADIYKALGMITPEEWKSVAVNSLHENAERAHYETRETLGSIHTLHEFICHS